MKADEECLRVLQLNSGSRNFGGVSSFLYNIYQNIDRSKVQFDFLSPDVTTYGIHRDEICREGGKIFEFHIRGNVIYKKLRLYKELKCFLKEHSYQIVHINSGNFFFNYTTVLAAKHAKVPVRILHSHNAGNTDQSQLKNLFFKMMKPFMEKNATVLFACSEKAASYMFTKKSVDAGRVRVIPNGIDTQRFRRDPQVRAALLKEWNLENRFVVGHVGRFMTQKNHAFLIDIFQEIHRREPRSVLLLFGEGELLPQIRDQVKRLGLEDSVRFMGIMNDIERAYQVMDVFLLPSLHEGLPVTGVEVQAAGIPLLVSDRITKELKIVDDVAFLPLEAGAAAWAEAALSVQSEQLTDHTEQIRDAGYDVHQVANRLQRFYIHAAANIKHQNEECDE
jgi:glycosyltransferase involved in cell wall biosynthesis